MSSVMVFAPAPQHPLPATGGVTVRTVDGAAGSGWYVHDRRGGSREESA